MQTIYNTANEIFAYIKENKPTGFGWKVMMNMLAITALLSCVLFFLDILRLYEALLLFCSIATGICTASWGVTIPQFGGKAIIILLVVTCIAYSIFVCVFEIFNLFYQIFF